MKVISFNLETLPPFASRRERYVWVLVSLGACVWGLWFAATCFHFLRDPAYYGLTETSSVFYGWLLLAVALCWGGFAGLWLAKKRHEAANN